MPNIRLAPATEQAKVDMTPMIDCTFQLIIFFITVQQLTVMEVATYVTLPKAQVSNPETAEDKDRLIVNIDENGVFHVSNMPRTLAQVGELLRVEAGPPGKNTATRDAEGFAKRTVFIRADVAAPYGKVQDVMAECRKHMLYKLAFRVKKWKEEEP